MANGNVSMPGNPALEAGRGWLFGQDYRNLAGVRQSPENVFGALEQNDLPTNDRAVVTDDDDTSGITVLASFDSMFGAYDDRGNKEDLQGGMDAMEGVPVDARILKPYNENMYYQPTLTNTGIKSPGAVHGVIPEDDSARAGDSVHTYEG